MSGQETLIPKKRGPKPTGGIGVMVRIQPALLAQLDAWIAGQPIPQPTRPEAVRRLVQQSLGEEEKADLADE